MIGFIAPILDSVTSVIDKLIPDPDEKRRIKAEMEKALLSAQVEKEVRRYEAIVAEAKSEDKWTSRARPSFMYVFYVLLLASLPFSIFFMFDPASAIGVTGGLKQWFQAIPDELYNVFLFGYLGYSATRSFDKWKGGGKNASGK